MKAMIFAAGLGTRLKPFTNNSPKALAPVAGKTLLQHAIQYLQKHHITDIIVNVHHFPELIEQLLIENQGFGSNVVISDERQEVLETGGGLKKAAWFFDEEKEYVVINVDVLTNLNLNKMLDAHNNKNQLVTLAVMKRKSSRYLLFNDKMELCGWRNDITGEEKIARNEQPLEPFAFSGMQILSNNIWAHTTLSGKFSLIDLYLEVAKTQIINGFDHTGDIFIDVGKPDSIEKATQLIKQL